MLGFKHRPAGALSRDSEAWMAEMQGTKADISLLDHTKALDWLCPVVELQACHSTGTLCFLADYIYTYASWNME